MTDVLKTSNRRRRRIVVGIAVLLLVLGCGLWWSMRPRIDPRLVGTWGVVDGSDPNLTLTIRSDGLMNGFFGEIKAEGRSFHSVYAGQEKVFFLRFRMRDQEFELLNVDPAASIWTTLKQTAERITRKTPEPITHRGTVVDITGDSFTLAIGGFGKCKYRRVDTKETR